MGEAAIERYRPKWHLQAQTQIQAQDVLTMTALNFGSLEVDECQALRSFFSALHLGYNSKARSAATSSIAAASGAGKAGGSSFGGSSLRKKSSKTAKKRSGNSAH